MTLRKIEASEPDIYSFFKSIKNVEVLEIDTVTEPKTKGGCPFEVVKMTKRRVKVGCNLDLKAEIEANQVAEGYEADYKISPRKWGARVAGTPFVENNGEIYLPCIVESNIETVYLDTNTGDPISMKVLSPWLVKPKEPKKQVGIVKKAIYRSYNLNAIVSVKLLDDAGTVLEAI
jgi:hypothetical protein|tara:strand:- start:566 stop:1090 length:525 start_codon:yes stop_codon:yes gene_type:complete